MRPFHYNGHPARVIFGSGTLSQLPDEVARLGLKRTLVLATPPQEAEAKRVAALLGDASAGVFAGAVMHTPVEVTEKAMAVVADTEADGVIAIGGGSTTGLGKAIAFRTDLPQIVVPTTYAGSEMTPILGETKDNAKTTQSSPKILPEVVIYDVDLTMSLPAGLSGTSGINAIAHAVEALYSRDANPIVDLMAARCDRRASSGAPPDRQGSRRPGGPFGRALRRLALRHVPRRRRHVAAPQALPHARRQLRPAARRDPYRSPAPCARLQRARRSRR